jgi:hypothetical protein
MRFLTLPNPPGCYSASGEGNAIVQQRLWFLCKKGPVLFSRLGAFFVRPRAFLCSGTFVIQTERDF